MRGEKVEEFHRRELSSKLLKTTKESFLWGDI